MISCSIPKKTPDKFVFKSNAIQREVFREITKIAQREMPCSSTQNGCHYGVREQAVVVHYRHVGSCDNTP